jgi:6-phosphogluconolactonase (cycloisomerase 2 family)
MIGGNDVSTNMTDSNPGAASVFVQTNERENKVITFRRDADGSLEDIGGTDTGGAGSAIPHLPSQGSLVLTGDGAHLLVTNAASNDVSVLAVSEGRLTLTQVIGSGGKTPRSVAEHDGLVYVLNTGTPSLVGFRLVSGQLEQIGDSTRILAPDADPAQVGFSPDGSTLIVTERGTDAIVTRAVAENGLLGEATARPSVGPTPYGFAFAGAETLVVTEAFGAMKGKAAASSYALQNGSVAPVSASVGNGRSEICWAVVSKDARYAFTTNFADGAVSRYAIGEDGTLSLEDATAGIAVDGETGLRDEDISRDGRFLYAIDADSRSIFGWEVGSSGSLTAIGSWNGLPATVAGLAAS